MKRFLPGSDGFNARRFLAFVILLVSNSILTIAMGRATILEMITYLTQIAGVVVFYELLYWLVRGKERRGD